MEAPGGLREARTKHTQLSSSTAMSDFPCIITDERLRKASSPSLITDHSDLMRGNVCVTSITLVGPSLLPRFHVFDAAV